MKNNRRRSIYFTEEDLDLLEYLNQKEVNLNRYLMRLIRQDMMGDGDISNRELLEQLKEAVQPASTPYPYPPYPYPYPYPPFSSPPQSPIPTESPLPPIPTISEEEVVDYINTTDDNPDIEEYYDDIEGIL